MEKESELFGPVKKLFCDLGYTVNAEVKGCDVTAVNGDDLIITELKRNLNVKLLAQGLERQRTGVPVYIAVPKPKKYSPGTFRNTMRVLKKLELGLIFVSIRGNHSYAEIIAKPQEYKGPHVNAKKKREIIREINGRTLDMNIGGVTQKKIATAYTEKCIHLVCILDMYGDLPTKKIKEAGGGDDCTKILYYNALGWFRHVSKGVYGVTEKGRREVLDYPELEMYYTDLVCKTRDKTDQ